MPKKVNEITLKILISIFILWGSASFFLFPVTSSINYPIIVVSVLSFYLLYKNKGSDFLFIYANFILVYSLYGLLLASNVPLVFFSLLVLLFSVMIFIYFKKSFFDGEEKLIFCLLFYSIAMIEVFLSLSYWLINPISKSMIFTLGAYFMAGTLGSDMDGSPSENNFKYFVYFSLLTLVILGLTITWGR